LKRSQQLGQVLISAMAEREREYLRTKSAFDVGYLASSQDFKLRLESTFALRAGNHIESQGEISTGRAVTSLG
jgi:hypothetical protein